LRSRGEGTLEAHGAGDPCHGFEDLIAELGRLTRNTIRLPGSEATFDKRSEPNPVQAKAQLELSERAPVIA
jgi:hypothetical protein